MQTQKLNGYLVWVSGDPPDQRFEIQHAVLRDDSELVIDFNCPLPDEPTYVYTMILRRKDSLSFDGEWIVGKGEDQYRGSCSCRLYSNGSRLALIGHWLEDGVSQPWFGELYPP